MTPQTAREFGDELKRLAKRIKKLSRRLRRLKERHNDLLAVHRLPPEIFTRIFFFLQADIHDVTPGVYYKWTAVMQVSQYWRRSALEHKYLWGGLSHSTTATRSSSWALTCLQRSLMTFSTSGDPFAETVLREIDRITTLVINVVETPGGVGTSKGLAKTLQNLGMAAPILKTFVIKGRNPFQHSTRNHIPKVLFNSFAPSLIRFAITEFASTLHQVPSCNMTKLLLVYPRGHPGSLSFTTLFQILRSTKLRTLELQHALFDGTAPADGITSISLPFLSSLSFSAHASHCTKFLSHVVVPPSCRVSIKGRVFGMGNAGDPQAFLDFTIPQLVTDPTDIYSVAVHAKTDGAILHMWKKNDNYHDPQFKGLSVTKISSLAVSYRIPEVHGQNQTNRLAFPTSLHLPGVQFVLLTSPSSLAWTPASDVPMQTLSMISSLSQLTMDAPFLSSFLNVVNSRPDAFFGLKFLTFKIHNTHPLERLHEALMRRQESGACCRLNKLVLNGLPELHQAQDVLKRLESLVESFALNVPEEYIT
ncbi:hypothetical protein BDN72DRAFT_848506 [Pluteus cervinus]|uniref:Uncharacterized protein n=1 Tax=Pluteus cervinus TaxID=181527 RepID=A0ACD3AB10_9AGAR|nr:hypothetical protein BDN72DRAFT_848506 [Pluteus cervinus]